ncbi:MAG: PD40 domain-containing protein [Deltaproteobacteria bacterium]|nr:PD40 domain-containing protein [Deltaproteobacteria bacterium]
MSNSGASGTGDARLGGMSGDGRYVVFSTLATNIGSGDTNGFEDVFVRDRLTGETRQISRGVGGAQTNSGSWQSSISYDGRFVVYRSNASNIVSGDTNGAADVFVYDMQTGTTELVSVNSSGTIGNGTSHEPTISADGRYVAFQSNATNLISGDTNATDDAFVYDRLTRTTQRVSVSSTGAQLALGGSSPFISGDGERVTFQTTSAVDGLDTNGALDAAVWSRTSGTAASGSVGVGGTTGNAASTAGRISSDGNTLMFASAATNLVSGDTNGVADVFIRNLITGQTTLVSVADDETLGNANSTTSQLSANGRFIAFRSTATNLVTGDTNAVEDVFVRDTVAGTTTRLTVSPTGVEANGASTNAALSGDGQYALIMSAATNLVAGDTNGAVNVFVTRNIGISRAVGFSSMITPFVGVGISTAKQAQMAQSTIDTYLQELNVSVGKLGATVSRAQAASAVVQNRAENLIDAASRILDADVAEESSALVARRVRQQSAQQVLALANNDLQLAKTFLGIA